MTATAAAPAIKALRAIEKRMVTKIKTLKCRVRSVVEGGWCFEVNKRKSWGEVVGFILFAFNCLT